MKSLANIHGVNANNTIRSLLRERKSESESESESETEPKPKPKLCNGDALKDKTYKVQKIEHKHSDPESKPEPASEPGVVFDLHIRTISTSECRFSNNISLIEVTPQWALPPPLTLPLQLQVLPLSPLNLIDIKPICKPKPYNSDCVCVCVCDCAMITNDIKNIKVLLNKAGHTVVGDGDVVKASKGVYMLLNKIEMVTGANSCTNSNSTTGNKIPTPIPTATTNATVEISIPIPNKFKLLLCREKELYFNAQMKTSGLVSSWVERHPEPGSIQHQVGYVSTLLVDKGINIDAIDIPPTPVPTTTASFEDWCCQIHAKCHIPIEYLLRECLFCQIPLIVSPSVMIPRKSSECLVEAAIAAVREVTMTAVATTTEFTSYTSCHRDNTNHSNNHSVNQSLWSDVGSSKDKHAISVLDMGTGSGCLLISTVKRIMEMGIDMDTQSGTNCSHCADISKLSGESSPGVDLGLGLVVGTDISTDALSIAHENICRHGLDDCVQLIQCPFDNTHNVVDMLNQSGSGVAEVDDVHKFTKHADPASNININTNIPQHFDGFDIILCNPPYSTKHDKSRISMCKLEMEPECALLTTNIHDAYKDLVYTFNSCVVNNNNNKPSYNNHDNNSSCANGSTSGVHVAGDDYIIQPGEHEKYEKYGKCRGLMHRGTIIIIEIGAGQHEGVQNLFKTVNKLSFIRYIVDYNDIIRGLMYRCI